MGVMPWRDGTWEYTEIARGATPEEIANKTHHSDPWHHTQAMMRKAEAALRKCPILQEPLAGGETGETATRDCLQLHVFISRGPYIPMGGPEGECYGDEDDE